MQKTAKLAYDILACKFPASYITVSTDHDSVTVKCFGRVPISILVSVIWPIIGFYRLELP